MGIRNLWRLRPALAAAAVVVAASFALYWVELPGAAGVLVDGVLLCALLVGAAYLAWRVLSVLLWRVGRKLAFSYFLIGVLPIPMVALLLALAAALVGGYQLGHVHRDALGTLAAELDRAAEAALTGRPFEAASGAAPAQARYRDGIRIGGDERAPESWPGWLEEPGEGFRFVAIGEASSGLAAVARDGGTGVLVFYSEIEQRLRDTTGIWTALLPAGDHGADLVRLNVAGEEFVLQTSRANELAARRDQELGGRTDGTSLWRRPILWWAELSGPLHALEDGEIESRYLVAYLNASPATASRVLFSSSSEINTAAWFGLAAVGGILFTIYLAAVLMAVYLIVGLTRAVNHLSQATTAVQAGDFSTRIRVRRKDQLGELQRNFNDMTANLEEAVAAAAQQEIVANELEIARDLQKSLLPGDLPMSEQVEFATLFEPSAAIGGDYFDILRVDQDRLAVVIADVSGHGLPTGLRMAMLKAALVILVEEAKPPREILRRLNALVRAQRQARFFVTATIGVVDFRNGTLELTSAGHPPTYLVRDGAVEEILVPGHPLGILGDEYGERRVELEPGDVAVWLSDGLIEAVDAADQPFGYERVAEALAGRPGAGAPELRDRLVTAVAAHAGGVPATDDRTLVALGYRPSAATSPSVP